MNKSQLWFWLVSLVLFSSAQADNSLRLPIENQGLTPVTLQLKWTHQFQFAGYYMAQAKGFYSKAGLDVTIKQATHAIDPIEEVISGRADFGVGTSELLIHRQSGKPVVVLGVIFQHSPLALLALENKGIDLITDLTGKRLMIEKNSSEIYALLRQSNLDPSKFTSVQHSLHTEDLLSDQVDAMTVYTTSETYELAKRQIPYRLFTPRMAGIDFYGDNFFTTEQLINQQPETVEAFKKASIEGWKYAMSHVQETIDYIVDVLKTGNRQQLQFEANKMQELMRTDLIEPGYMSEKRWQHIASVYKELGLVPNTEKALKNFAYKQENVVTKLESKIRDLILVVLSILLVALLIILYVQRYYGMKSQLDTITDKAPLSILLIDEQFKVVQWNHQAELTFGWTSKEAIGKNIFDFLVFNSHHNKVNQGLDKVFEDQITLHIENKNLHKDGHEISCNWSNAPYELNGKKHIICMALDTSELRDFKALSMTTSSQPKSQAADSEAFLSTLVEVMCLSLQIWEESTSKSKTKFADESGLWRVSIDGGTAKTRTLDKYFSIETIPKKPRWKNVINTANYILRTFPNHPKTEALEKLKSSIN